MNYYEHHIGDYAEATAHLSFAEDAAYSRLIRKYYANEKQLPADIKTVQRLVGARTKEEREAVSTVLEEFFDLRDDGWHNTRCDEEIERYQDKQAKAKRSAEARWSKPKAHSDGNANASPNAMRTHSDGNALQSPVTRHQTEEPRTTSSLTSLQGAPANLGRDDSKPNQAQWWKFFNDECGVGLDPQSVHDRKKFRPLAQAWTNAGVTLGQMRRAVAKAQAEAREPIAFLPGYADRVLASMTSNTKAGLEARNAEALQAINQGGTVVSDLEARNAAVLESFNRQLEGAAT